MNRFREGGDETVSVAPQGGESGIRSDGDSVPIELVQVRTLVGVGHLGAQGAVRGDDLHPGATARQVLGARGTLVGAVLVEHEHLFARLDLPAEDVPQSGRVLPSLEVADVRQASSGDDHHVGALCPHVGRLRERVQADVDAEALDAAREPVGDPGELAAPRRSRREQDLTTELSRRLEEDDLVTALRAHPRRLQTSGAAAHDEHSTPRAG